MRSSNYRSESQCTFYLLAVCLKSTSPSIARALSYSECKPRNHCHVYILIKGFFEIKHGFSKAIHLSFFVVKAIPFKSVLTVNEPVCIALEILAKSRPWAWLPYLWTHIEKGFYANKATQHTASRALASPENLETNRDYIYNKAKACSKPSL